MAIPALSRITQPLFLFALAVLAIGMPWSTFMMSNSLILLFIAWLASPGLLQRIRLFSRNKHAVLLSGVFLLHIVFLIHTSDMEYGLRDIRIKIPLMLLPLILSTSPPLTGRWFHTVLILFSASVLTATFVCFLVLAGFTNKLVLQPRDASIFISHIRFSLMIAMSIFIGGYWFFRTTSALLKALIMAAILWMVLFLIMMEAGTGIAVLFLTAGLLMIRQLFLKFKPWIGISLLVLAGLGGLGGIFGLFQFWGQPTTHPIPVPLPEKTSSGQLYVHDTLRPETENGHKVWILICEPEMDSVWNRRSALLYSGKDLKGNELKYTLIRFLASKGLTRDAAGVTQLSQQEIEAIEKGIANVDYIGLVNPLARIRKIIWEFDNYLRGGNPSGHSVTQRLEYWKAGSGIWAEHFFFGVGTGDPLVEFRKYYEAHQSTLNDEWRLRSHNQFLAMAVSMGLAGLLIFIVSLLLPPIQKKKFRNYFYFCFFSIVVLSFLNEDTLETQAGVTFFAFFNSLLLFSDPGEDPPVS